MYPGEAVQEGGDQRAIWPGELRLVDLPLQHGELVAQCQDLGILVMVAHRQEPYEGEHACQGQVGQSQQHRMILAEAGAGRQLPSEASTAMLDWRGRAAEPLHGLTSVDEVSDTYRRRWPARKPGDCAGSGRRRGVQLAGVPN